MPVRPHLSVLMSVYNGEPGVAMTVGSVLRQTFDHFELIVVDSGSTDGTKATLEGQSDPGVRVVQRVRARFLDHCDPGAKVEWENDLLRRVAGAP